MYLLLHVMQSIPCPTESDCSGLTKHLFVLVGGMSHSTTSISVKLIGENCEQDKAHLVETDEWKEEICSLQCITYSV